MSGVISYGDAWRSLAEHHPQELHDIEVALYDLTPENIVKSEPSRDSLYRYDNKGITSPKLLGCWENAIGSRDWIEATRFAEKGSPPPFFLRLGHIKNRVSVSFERNPDGINRWLYTSTPIAIRNGYIDIPIAIALLRESENHLFERRTMSRAIFERAKMELSALTPLSHASPFLILGASLVRGPLDILELESEADVMSRQVVVDRSIEFPPEYHQAGLGILNYFGTVLREKYPDYSAKVRIEQDGLLVRLIVESENGDREIIEKALAEYALVVSGGSPPEDFFQSATKVLELKNELRIAQLRVESQRDLIAHQGEELRTLRDLLSQALGSTRNCPLTITVSPTINVSTSSASASLAELDLPAISECLQELTRAPGVDSSLQLRLLDLEEAIRALSEKKTAGDVKKSGALHKLKRFLDDVNEVGGSAGKIFGKAGSTIEALQRLAKKYNDIAAWCGAPQVPPIFLRND